MRSCDVHACPGSGKTTLLVAKLAILARKWPWRDRGVLVLSHTNVARQEVERRLAAEPSGARLLTYPHFIGTIHAFVNRFVSLPFLRDIGVGDGPIREPRIDDELFAQTAIRIFYSSAGRKAYPQARAYLERQDQEGRRTIASLSYGEGDQLTAVGKVPSRGSPTGTQLAALKDRVSRLGIFLHADMFRFAERSLAAHPFVSTALRRRFPWVFIDEAQDSSLSQTQLLEQVFTSSETIVQRLGDDNQGIFVEGHDSTRNAIAWRDSLDLPKSQRMAPKLASLVSPLAAVHPLRLVGNPKRKDRSHTVFVFTNETITGVVPLFAELVLREWGGVLPADFRAKAVGFRKKMAVTQNLPNCLADYWANFRPAPSPERPPSAALIEVARHSHRLIVSSGAYWDAHRILFDGLARLVELSISRRFTRSELVDGCRAGEIDERRLRALIRLLCEPGALASRSAWQALAGVARDLLCAARTSTECVEYLEWSEADEDAEPQHERFYRHKSEAGQVAIEIATIHAVKGETHDATLVLETHFYEHDMELGLRVLTGTSKAANKGRFLEHMKRLFVAATRPRELLCLAVHRDHVNDEQLTTLNRQGWRIQSVDRGLNSSSERV